MDHDTANLLFNTAIAQMMVMVNELYKIDTLPRSIWESFILTIAPYVPHMAEELWERAGHAPSVANAEWPAYVEELTIDDELEIVVQINGKVRVRFNAAKGSSREALLETAMASERIQELTQDKEIIKTIIVPDKLVNIVVK